MFAGEHHTPSDFPIKSRKCYTQPKAHFASRAQLFSQELWRSVLTPQAEATKTRRTLQVVHQRVLSSL